MNVAVPTASRLESLDALRGFAMFWIVGADAIGGALHQLAGGAVIRTLATQMEHATWEGFHFYDLIFPLFLFMVGASVPLSLDKAVATGTRGVALRRIARRTLLLFALGIFYYGGIATEPRLLGVLQRIALCYGTAGLLYLALRPRGLAVVIVALLVGYWALLSFVPVPGFGAGDFREGHNLTNWFDARFLPGRQWNGDHDPEGLLSTLPAIASCLLGVLAMRWLQRSEIAPGRRVAGLLVAGGAALAAGWAWAVQFPVIKNLWTSSFVLVAGGWSVLLLAGFYWLIDVCGVRAWARPLVWMGSNALVIYLVSNVVDFGKLAERLAGGPVAAALNVAWPGLGSLALALIGAGLCILLCRFLFVRGLLVRL